MIKKIKIPYSETEFTYDGGILVSGDTNAYYLEMTLPSVAQDEYEVIAINQENGNYSDDFTLSQDGKTFTIRLVNGMYNQVKPCSIRLQVSDGDEIITTKEVLFRVEPSNNVGTIEEDEPNIFSLLQEAAPILRKLKFNEVDDADEADEIGLYTIDDEVLVTSESDDKLLQVLMDAENSAVKMRTKNGSASWGAWQNITAPDLSNYYTKSETNTKIANDIATAVSNYYTKTQIDASLLLKADQTDLDEVEALIPSQATSSNQLADKSFVNSSIGTNTANYISDNGEPFTSVADLPTDSSVTNNDYAFVTGIDQIGNTYFDRYKATVVGTTVTWAKEYRLNNSSFTANQWLAINSGITPFNVTKISEIDDKANSSDVYNKTTSDGRFEGKFGTITKAYPETINDVHSTTKGIYNVVYTPNDESQIGLIQTGYLICDYEQSGPSIGSDVVVSNTLFCNGKILVSSYDGINLTWSSYSELVKIKGAKIGGSSGTQATVDANGNVIVPIASSSDAGVGKINPLYGVGLTDQNAFKIYACGTEDIAARTQLYKPITPYYLNNAVKAALSDANRINDMTTQEQENARGVIGAGSATKLTEVESIAKYVYDEFQIEMSAAELEAIWNGVS